MPYVAQTLPWSPELFHPLDDVVSLRFLPAVTGRQAFGSVERDLLSLPARLGGLGSVVPSIHLSSFYALSQQIAAHLIDKLLQQSPSCSLTIYEGMYQSKHEVGASCCNDLITFARSFPEYLSFSLRPSFGAASECRASCWLTTLPIAEHRFAMPKGEFHNALCLRFGWQLACLPLSCVCGKSFNVEHAFSCHCGSFPMIHHNEIRDLTANLLSEVCQDVGVEPAL